MDWHLHIIFFRSQGSDRSSVNLTAECNTDCGCSMSLYDPVCADGIQYFTPCHAGCSQPAVDNNVTGAKVCKVHAQIHLYICRYLMKSYKQV